MKKILLTLFVLLFLFSDTYSQFNQFPNPNKGDLTGGLGLTWIDGQPFYAFRFRPEISFAKVGVGLDLNLEFSSQGKLRKENFNETSDYLSIIRYVRYGLKRDPVYVKVGALDFYTLGHGSIMYQYNNSPSFDTRTIGTVIDLDFDKFGFESIYSNFAQAGVLGMRGYVRPLQYTSAASIPIIGNLEVGATFAGDFNKNSGKVLVFPTNPFPTNPFPDIEDKGSIKIIGLDLGLPLFNFSMANASLYFDYAKILNFGSGAASGIILELNGLGIFNASAKLERRWNNDKYMPAYFNSLYEIERYTDSVSSKATTLEYLNAAENGYYGELGISVLGTFNVIGGLQKLDNHDGGILHLTADVAPSGLSFVARAGYDKIFVNGADVFKLNDRSILFTELGYKPYPYLIVSLVYQWTFTPIRNSDKEVIGYKPQKKIEPRISFVYPFNM
ncbi:MAG: hypothetical protein M0P61_06560 [Ignavibacteriaceae bacterium]|jgi:hypothetical protein|nr:hypothetical protein [Ignavibacteriaceae bacterium]